MGARTGFALVNEEKGELYGGSYGRSLGRA